MNNFVPGVLDAMTVDGKLYALPFDVMPYGIFVNYDVLDNANVDYPDLDWTLDQFVEMCKAVTNKSDPANPRIAIARNVIENDYIRFLTMFCAVYPVGDPGRGRDRSQRGGVPGGGADGLQHRVRPLHVPQEV